MSHSGTCFIEIVAGLLMIAAIHHPCPSFSYQNQACLLFLCFQLILNYEMEPQNTMLSARSSYLSSSAHSAKHQHQNLLNTNKVSLNYSLILVENFQLDQLFLQLNLKLFQG